MGGHVEPFSAFYTTTTTTITTKDENNNNNNNNNLGISFHDVNALYPFEMLNGNFFIGDIDRQILTLDTDQLLQGVLEKRFHGFIFCNVLPNRSSLFPGLPSKNAKGRLVFTACRTCADEENMYDICQHSHEQRCLMNKVYYSEELYFSMDQLGYKVLAVHEVYHYPNSSRVLFKDFIEKLNVMKTVNSNLEGQFANEHQMETFIKEMNLTKKDFNNNPCKRNLAKLLMNSSYGRLGIRPSKNEKCFIRERKDLVQLLEDPAVDIVSLDAMKNGNILRASVNIEMEQQPALPISSVALASAITSMARIHLLKIILYANSKENVIPLYSDTDCLISLHPKSPNVVDEAFIMNPGMKIGQMKRELSKGEYIETFVSLGAKVYGYETNQGVLKLL